MAQGTQFLAQGSEAVQPVITHLLKLLSGDPQTINEAILPEARGVMAQYDAARQAIGEFTPRGGGQASAISRSRFDEAADIAGLKSTARRSAVGELARLGTEQERIGAGLEQVGLGAFGTLLEESLKKEADKRKFWAQLGLGIGAIAAGIFFPPAGVAIASQIPTISGGERQVYGSVSTLPPPTIGGPGARV
jgi:hypothetical protein